MAALDSVASEGTLRLRGSGERLGGSEPPLPPRPWSRRRPRPRFSWNVLPTWAVPSTFGGVGPEARASKSALLSISFHGPLARLQRLPGLLAADPLVVAFLRRRQAAGRRRRSRDCPPP